MTLEQLFERVEQGSRTLAAAKTNVDAAQHGIDAALSQRLPDLSANLSVSYIGNALLTDRDFSNAHGLHSPHLGNSFAIEAQEAIYTGGALSAGIKLAELGKKQAETGVVLTRQQARFLALGQYLDLYKVDNRMRVYRENMSLTRQLIADIKQRQQQGMALKNDITRYELQMEQLSLGLEQLQNTRKILNHQLCNTLALPHQTNVQPDTTFVSASLPRDPEAAWQNRSTTTSPLLEQSRLNIGIAQQKERIAKSELLPKVAIVAANNFDGPITFELPPIDKNLNIWYVGVGVKYNIGALYKKNKQVRQAAAQTQIAQQQYNVQREAIDNRTNAAYIKYMFCPVVKLLDAGGFCDDGNGRFCAHLSQERTATLRCGKHPRIRRDALRILGFDAERCAHGHTADAAEGVALGFCGSNDGVDGVFLPCRSRKAEVQSLAGVRKGGKRRIIEHAQA